MVVPALRSMRCCSATLRAPLLSCHRANPALTLPLSSSAALSPSLRSLLSVRARPALAPANSTSPPSRLGPNHSSLDQWPLRLSPRLRLRPSLPSAKVRPSTAHPRLTAQATGGPTSLGCRQQYKLEIPW